MLMFFRGVHLCEQLLWLQILKANLLSPPLKTERIKGGVELPIVIYTLPLPIKLTEVPIVVFSIHVKVLGELVTPKPIPLILPKIKVGVEVTLIDNVTHAFEVLKTLDTILKDTPIMERLDFSANSFG
jgi:hypothetical protein